MPAWEDYKAEAKSRGALALEVFVVQSAPAGTPDAVKANLPDHLAYQAQMEAEGHLVFAGPVSDETGDLMEGAGMIIYRAPNFKAARALAEGDPMHASGARTYELRKWLINEGGLSLSVSLSAQVVKLG